MNVMALLRPRQWAKNIFVFLPLFFDGGITDLSKLEVCAMAFVAFSLLASSIYCFNDLLDIEADRLHPTKKGRPLASGEVKKWQGVTLMAMLAISGIYIGYKAPNTMVLAILLFYVLMNVAYTLWLKRYAIIDVMIISVGFVLRLMVGGAATGIELSHWIVLMTFLLALFLAFAKRRDDLLISQQTGVVVRKNVSSYNVGFLNSVMSIICAVTMMCYIMYTVSPEVIARFGRYLYLTSIFVLAGILRYLQLTHVYEKSGSPTKILYRDRFIQAVIVAWVASFIIIVYAR